MQALILAAGYATRLYPLTKNRPKPLLRIGEKTILDYLLEKFSDIKIIDHVYVVTNERFFADFRDWAERTNRSDRYPDFEVQVVNDCTSSNETRLGAIADIQFVLDRYPVKEDCLITAGDNIFQFDFRAFLQFFQAKQSDIILAHEVKNVERLRSAGVVEIDSMQRVIGFEEKPKMPKSRLIAPALYIIKKEHLTLFGQYLDSKNPSDAPGSFIAWLQQVVPVHAFVMQEHYYDIGTLEMYKKVCREFNDRATA